MTSYTIHGFPQKVMEPEATASDTDLLLKEYSKNLITSFEQLPFDIEDFNNHYTKFADHFDLWQNGDWIRVIQPYIMPYYELKNMVDLLSNDDEKENEERDEFVEEKKQEIEKEVFKIAGQKGIDYLKHYEPEPVTIENEVYEQMESTVKKAFWDIFYENIEKKDYSQIPDMLKDIRKMVVNLVPNRHDIHDQFDKEIDIELITQMVEMKAMNSEDIYKFMFGIIDYVQRLYDDDDDIKMFREMLKQWFEEPKPYAFILTEFFKSIFQKLEKSSNDVLKFYTEVYQNQGSCERTRD